MGLAVDKSIFRAICTGDVLPGAAAATVDIVKAALCRMLRRGDLRVPDGAA